MSLPHPAPGSVDSCFECDAPVRTVWHDHSFPYCAGDATIELSARIPVRVCTDCDAESIGHEAEILLHEAVCRHHGVLSPQEIRELREDHRLSRAAFAEMTGLSEASLHRWEKGILIQNRGNDRYLRLLRFRRNIHELRRMGDDSRTQSETWHPEFRVMEPRPLSTRATPFVLRPARAA